MKPLSIHLPSKRLSRYERRAVRVQTASPTTDQHYQTTIDAPASSTSRQRPTMAGRAAALRSFRQLGVSLDDKASRWSFALETVVFGLVIALVAWSLISLLVVLAQTARG